MNAFLTAQWINLILVSWKVAPSLLEPHLPRGTILDDYQGSVFVSLVAFEFRQTRVKGLSIPWHVNFPEVNLRFYVKGPKGRGVVFLREFVPSPAIVLVARWRYHEPYAACPIRAVSHLSGGALHAQYRLRRGGRSYRIEATGEATPLVPGAESLEHVLKEHERGYGRTPQGDTLMYRVTHPAWELYPIQAFHCDVDFGAVYGDAWSGLSAQPPANVMLSRGSAVTVFEPTRVEHLT